MKLKGNDYAKVPERLKLFREQNPRGQIVTTPEITENTVMFKAQIIKDKSDPNSASATGHSIGEFKNDKKFEKLETVAVGRALSNLGYLANGEIAGTEEMELFEEFKAQELEKEVEMVMEAMKKCETLDDLKEVYLNCGRSMPIDKVVKLKNKLKIKLQKNENN